MGTKYYEEYVIFVQDQLDILGQDENLDEESVHRAVDEAMNRYSQDRPRRIAQRYESTSGQMYSLPDEWKEGLSIILRVQRLSEQFVGQQRVFIGIEEFDVYDSGDGSGKQVHLYDYAPSATETFIIYYTGAHTVSAIDSTVFDFDFEAVGYLVSSILALKLAGQLLKNRDPHKPADSLNFRTLSDEYEKLSRLLFERYKDHMDLPSGMESEGKGMGSDVTPALSIGDIQVTPPWGLPRYLTHGRR